MGGRLSVGVGVGEPYLVSRPALEWDRIPYPVYMAWKGTAFCMHASVAWFLPGARASGCAEALGLGRWMGWEGEGEGKGREGMFVVTDISGVGKVV